MANNNINNQSISDFFSDISVKLETQSLPNITLGAAGMTSKVHRANASHFFFGKNFAEMNNVEKNALFGMAMSTVSAKQASRMVMVALPIMSRLDPACIPIMKEMALKMPKSNAGQQVDAITPVRMASAFPDIAIVGACLSNNQLVTEFYSIWDDERRNFPTALMFAQAYQLNLTPELKRAAAHFNVHYWMNTVKSKLEVTSGPKFNYTYMATGLEDNYEPFVLKSKMVPSLAEYLVGIFDLEKLMKYHISVLLAFQDAQKVSEIRVNEAYATLSQSAPFLKMVADLALFTDVNMDMFPDHSKRLMSATDEFVSARNQALLAGPAQAAPTTIIQQMAPVQERATFDMRELANLLRQPTAQPSNPEMEAEKNILRIRFPTMDEKTLDVLALDEIRKKKEQSKGFIRRTIGW